MSPNTKPGQNTGEIVSLINFPTVEDVSRELSRLWSDVVKPGNVEDLDVRLQVCTRGAWYVHYGDPGWDLDHNGWWGAATLGKYSEIRAVAADLVRQARDDFETDHS